MIVNGTTTFSVLPKRHDTPEVLTVDITLLGGDSPFKARNRALTDENRRLKAQAGKYLALQQKHRALTERHAALSDARWETSTYSVTRPFSHQPIERDSSTVHRTPTVGPPRTQTYAQTGV